MEEKDLRSGFFKEQYGCQKEKRKKLLFSSGLIPCF
jgi:hypothetical protein